MKIRPAIKYKEISVVTITRVPCEQDLGTAFILKLRTNRLWFPYIYRLGTFESVPRKVRDDALGEVGAEFGREYMRLLRLNIHLDASCKVDAVEMFEDDIGIFCPREVKYFVEMTVKFISFDDMKTK